MCRVGKKPETRARARAFPLPELDPSPTFNTRPIPETRPTTRGYPRVTRLGKICCIFGQNSKYFGYFSKFQAIFCQIFEIFGFFLPKFLAVSAEISKFLPVFRQNPETFVKINATYYPTGTRVPNSFIV